MCLFYHISQNAGRGNIDPQLNRNCGWLLGDDYHRSIVGSSLVRGPRSAQRVVTLEHQFF